MHRTLHSGVVYKQPKTKLVFIKGENRALKMRKNKKKHQVRVHRFGGGIFVAWDPCTFKESAGQMVGLTVKCRPPAPLDQHS